MYFNLNSLLFLFIPFKFSSRECNPCNYTSPPKHTNRPYVDVIVPVEKHEGIIDKSPKGVMISRTKEVRWNQEAISSLEPQIKIMSSDDTNISPNSHKQCEVKVSSSPKFSHDNMTTTDTTGSYLSSASNIDVSSASVQEEGIYLLV